ncbi:hypothetical protein P9654_09915 [Bacillus atrophaeus]|uniref:hypothetical protein n=1 Tax=Bacillus atrophaeus TaxID=1452 RepID=UPI002E237267|nr:hypothetical protein [Bacillus atrophaeus]
MMKIEHKGNSLMFKPLPEESLYNFDEMKKEAEKILLDHLNGTDKEFKIWLRDSVVFAFDKADIESIEEQPSGLVRLTLKDGDWFEGESSVDEWKELFKWEGAE